jgi:hypothetical protein
VELCGALKNCVTLSCGFVAGFGLGHNAKAAAIRAGHREMVRFGGEFFGVREVRKQSVFFWRCHFVATKDRTFQDRLGTIIGKTQPKRGRFFNRRSSARRAVWET